MDSAETLIAQYAREYQKRQESELPLAAYLEACGDDPMLFATAAERLVHAIGEPRILDTARDERLGRVFLNRTIKIYPAFEDFYGMEETVERIVGFFRYAAQGLEEHKQILYLLGPVGGGKSSLAERIKALMENNPIYVLKAGDEISPVFEGPLGLFNPEVYGEELETRFGIPKRRLTGLVSPWAVKRLDEFGGDLSASRWCACIPPGCARSPSPRPSRATRTTRTSPRWWARWTSANWSSSARTTPTPTATPAA